MEDIEYNRCDREVIGMTNRHHDNGSNEHLFSVIAETQNVVLMEHVEPEKIFEKPEVTREKLILQLWHELLPVGVGIAWVLAAFEGLADPAFTSIITGACIGWGCVEWKWVRGNA